MRMKKIKRFLVEWLLLTIASAGLFWLLWWILGKNDVGEGESLADIVVFDVAYCAVVSLCVMAVCTAFVRLLAGKMERRWAFLVASVGSLIVNILIVHLLEIAFDSFAGIPYNDPEIIEGLYICGIIATMLSILLLSNEHYRLYTEQLSERLRQEKTVLRQRLDIEQLQRIVDDLRTKEASANSGQDEDTEKHTESQTLDVQSLLTQLGIAQRTYRTRFLAPVIDGVTVIDTRDISHITIEGEKLMAYLNDGKSVRLEETSLDTVESLLDPADFFRANRQYIVSIRAIARLSNFFNQTKILHLRAFPDLEIKISKDKYSQLREWVNG